MQDNYFHLLNRSDFTLNVFKTQIKFKFLLFNYTIIIIQKLVLFVFCWLYPGNNKLFFIHTPAIN